MPVRIVSDSIGSECLEVARLLMSCHSELRNLLGHINDRTVLEEGA